MTTLSVTRRPATGALRQLQVWLLTHPRIATLFATGSLFFETGFVFAPFHAWVGLLFGVAGFAFHGGILALQGLDFVTYWTPALFAFIVGVPLDNSPLDLSNTSGEWYHNGS